MAVFNDLTLAAASALTYAQVPLPLTFDNVHQHRRYHRGRPSTKGYDGRDRLFCCRVGPNADTLQFVDQQI